MGVYLVISWKVGTHRTGLVHFVDELGTLCWEVPLEYGFEVLVGSEQHTMCFIIYNCVILSLAPSVQIQQH